MSPPQLVTIDASEPLEKIIQVIVEDGGIIVASLLSPELVKECVDAIEPHMAGRKLYDAKGSHNELSEDFFPEGSQRVYSLLARMPEQITKIMRLPVWRGIMGRFLNDEFASYVGDKLIPQKSGYMLASTAALRLTPGAKPQPLHRDQIAFQTRPDSNNPLFTPMVGCLIAGSKCTYKNGATKVIPKSHLWGANRAPKEEECTFAEMEPGSALFTLGSTYHGAGENKCAAHDPDALRTLFAVFAQRDYFRQDQDEVLATPMSIARKLPDDILKLAGYYKAIGGVGYVEDHEHPAEYMHGTENGIGAFGAPTAKVAV